MLTASTVMIAGMGLAAPAQAQLIGPCPSPLSPPPCIIHDYKKITDMAREHAQQVQRLKDMYEQAKETKANAESIGETLASMSKMVDAQASIIKPNTFTTVSSGTSEQLVDNFNAKMYAGPDASVDSLTAARNRRFAESISSNSDALATSWNASNLIEESTKRMVCLGRAAKTSKDMRSDWLINSQIKLEVNRQNYLKNQLLTVVLENESVAAANQVPETTVPQSNPGSGDAQKPIGERDGAWKLQDNLEEIEKLVRTTFAALAIANGSKTIREDAKSIRDQYNNSVTKRDAALAKLKSRARAWSSRGSTQIVNLTLSELERIDASMKQLRERPINQLGSAFAQRKIDANKMVELDIDPRQFIGTWGDPLKNKVTLDMANALLKGRLDNYIDGDDDNDEYRELVIAYNDARLEEAWMKQHAAEADEISREGSALIERESKLLGYELDAASATEKLQELVKRANELAAEIQKSDDPAVVAQAKRSLDAINRILNGTRSQTPSNANGSRTIPASPTSPAPVPTPAPDGRANLLENPSPDNPPVAPR